MRDFTWSRSLYHIRTLRHHLNSLAQIWLTRDVSLATGSHMDTSQDAELLACCSQQPGWFAAVDYVADVDLR